MIQSGTEFDQAIFSYLQSLTHNLMIILLYWTKHAIFLPNISCSFIMGTPLCMAQANVGQNVTLHNPSLGLFSGTCLHTTSYETLTHNTNNQQTSLQWWWSRSALQQRGFDESTPPE